MKTTKRVFFAGLICLCILFIGCDSKKSVDKKEADEPQTEREYVEEMISKDVELNERQKKVIEKEHIDAETYEDLTDLQKEAIIKIDMLLTYLEDKYDKEFEYRNFNLTSEKCFLVARAADDDYRREITANMKWKDDKYVYSDTYEMEVTLSDKYKECVIEHISEELPGVNFDVDVNLSKVLDEEGARDDVLKYTTGGITVLMEDCFEDEKKSYDYLHSLGEWLATKSDAHPGIQLRIYSKEDYPEVNVFNRNDTYIIDVEKYRYDCTIDNQDEIIIDGPYK